MAEVVNLRLVRKRKARGVAESAAGQNRVEHGLTKAERKLAENERALTSRRLDGQRRDETP